MKNFLITALSLANITFSLFAQWEPEFRLTNNASDASTTYNNARCLAVNGNIINFVWLDNRDGNYELYHKRSTDAGINWGPDTRLTNQSDPTLFHCVAASGNVIHIVWQDRRDVNDQIYYKRSTDGGLSWSVDLRLINTTSFSFNPSVAVSGNNVHVVCQDSRNVNPEIYYKSSSDGGLSWGADIRLTSNSGNSLYASVAVSGNTVNVVWHEDRDGNYEIYNKHSTDGGVNWGTDTRLTNASGFSWYSSTTAFGSLVSVVWEDNRDGNYEIYFKRSTDGGASWGTDMRLTNASGISNKPSAISSNSGIHIVWHDNRDGHNEIYYKRSTDSGISWEADFRLRDNPASCSFPTIEISGAVVHVVWTDFRFVSGEIYYKRDPTGNPIGIINISSEIPNKFSLSQNYPNPFNPVTNIEFAISKSSFVKLSVYDALGKEIDVLVNENLSPGIYRADWNASKHPSGVYFYKLSTDGFTETKKMMLIK